jgi:prepilin-type N-terminal cleavage/methylation domain-containing protein
MIRKEHGFSLIELLMVVVILGVIMALAVPGLQRARHLAQSGSAIQSLRTMTTAENIYERRFKVYAALVDLAPEGALTPDLAAGSKSGYDFSLTLSVDSKRFTANADPQFDPAIAPHYFTDDTAVIRFNDGAVADATSPPIPR